MAVRFLPPNDSGSGSHGDERTELAEVIDFRSRLPRILAEGVSRESESIPVSSDDSSRAERRNVTALRPLEEGIPSSDVTRCDDDAGESSPPRDALSVTDDSGPERSSLDDAVRLLARKALSSGELARRLAELGHPPVEIESAVDECFRSLYLDDVGLARTLTERLRERKQASRSHIRMKLRERHISEDAIETALGELDTTEELELLRSVAAERARRLGGLDRPTAERRLLGYLARRGWTGEHVTRAARAALDEHGSGVRFH